MIRLAPVVERLKAAGFRRVYGALELAGLEKAPGQLPAQFVVPQGWEAAPNRLTGGAHDQQVGEVFGIVSALEAVARNEDRISDQLAEEERRVIAALVGWVHPDCESACDAGGGRLLSVSGTTLSWLTTFRTKSRIRKIPS